MRQMPESKGGRFSRSDMFARLIEHLRQAVDETYMIGHDMKEDGDTVNGQGFLAMAQLLERAISTLSELATRRSH